ncbi:MAG TPA: hypothetical protein VEJ22_00895 [Nitrospirota bacterium]|nr:hypothetical protein [Nitrospirota bacterium]
MKTGAGRFQFYAHHPISRDDAFVGLPILTAPIVIGGATGFIVGDVPCL